MFDRVDPLNYQLVNPPFPWLSCLQILLKKKNKKNEFDDFINDESSEEEDPIPKKKDKGKIYTCTDSKSNYKFCRYSKSQ